MVKGAVTKLQVAYITDYLSGMTLKEVAEKHGKKRCSIGETIHRAIGYDGVHLDRINRSVFQAVLDKYESQ